MKIFAILFTLLLLPSAGISGAPPGTDFRVVSGAVTDEAGRPLGGVRVSILDGQSLEIGSRVTESSGRFLFRLLPAGAATVVAEANGFTSAKAELSLGHGMVGMQVALTLARPGAACKANTCVAVSRLRPSESLRIVTAKAATAAVARNSATPAATTNSAADFTIQTTVAATAPPRFGFNFAHRVKAPTISSAKVAAWTHTMCA